MYASSGDGESTQDIVFGAHNIISENGSLLAEATKFKNEAVYADIDIDRIWSERRRMSTFTVDEDKAADEGYVYVSCPDIMQRELKLKRFLTKHHSYRMTSMKGMQDVRKFLTYRHMDLRKT